MRSEMLTPPNEGGTSSAGEKFSEQAVAKECPATTGLCAQPWAGCIWRLCGILGCGEITVTENKR